MNKNYQYKTGDLYHNYNDGIIFLCLRHNKLTTYESFYFHTYTFIMPQSRCMSMFVEQNDIKINE